VAVIVDDPNFNIDVEETLIDLISKAVSITSDNISVTNLNFPSDSQQTSGPGLSSRQRLLLILGLALLFVVLLLVAILVFLRMRKKKAEEEATAANPEDVGQSIEKEIEEHKRMLQSEALANSNQMENAITQEIRDFAKENPEITALLRSMLKEDQ
jgi:flagellar biosynthesis/type III secretory pathway M-ring protein FliF/YscJ